MEGEPALTMPARSQSEISRMQDLCITELSILSQVLVCSEDTGSTHAGLVCCRSNNVSLVSKGNNGFVQLANIGRAEAIIILEAYDISSTQITCSGVMGKI